MSDPSRRLLHNQAFMRLVAGQAISALGDGMHQVAFLWLAYKLSPSLATTSLMLGATSLPYLLFGLLGGAAADRWPRRWILLGSHALRGAAVALLALAAHQGVLAPLHLGVVAFLLASIRCVYYPAFKAACAEVLPREDRQQGNATAIATIKTMNCIGPAAGGAILAGVSVEMVFALDALSYATAFALVLGLRRGIGDGVRGAPASIVRGVLDSLREITGSQALRIALGAHCVTLLLLSGPELVGYPRIADTVWGSGAAGLGTGLALKGVGCALGYAALSRFTMRRPERWALVGMALWASASLTIATVSSFPAALGGFFAAGVAFAVTEGPISYLLQLDVPASRVGGMFGVWSTAAFASEALSAPLAGAAVSALGPRATLVASATTVLLVVSALLVRRRSNHQPTIPERLESA
jgi:predicted MFS family arabinose efflux permease